MNKTVALLFSRPGSDKEFFLDKTARDSYHLLAKYGKERDIDVRLVLEETYLDGKFTSCWKFEENSYIYHEEECTPSQILLQTRENTNEYTKRINNVFLETMCRDKYMTAQLFPKYCKKTIHITRDSSSTDFDTDLIVIKPRFGLGGEDIQVISKNEYTPSKYAPKQFVAQEFIDSSTGIPGLIQKRHEMRLYIFSGEIKASYLRVPAENSYIANISQGAKEQQFDLSDLPHEVFPLVNYVDAAFAHITPRLYTIDVMFEDGKPWIVELNDTPGMPDVTVQPLTDTYLHEMLTLLSNE